MGFVCDNLAVFCIDLELVTIDGGSSKGRTLDFESKYRGSNPCPPAIQVLPNLNDSTQMRA